MKPLRFILLPLAGTLMLSACQTDGWQNAAQSVLNSGGLAGLGGPSSASNLTIAQITAGLKEALRIGSGNVVSQLSKAGGFNLDPKIRIPLPSTLAKVDSALKTVGLSYMTEDLQNRMNGAAEQATGEALSLFVSAIQQMTIADARSILSGQQDAATQYLRKTMGVELSQKIQPIVSSALVQAGAVQAYDKVMGKYQTMPFMPDVKADLNGYVTQKAIDGIFYYVAQEEAAIRANPAKRTTELLRMVFGHSGEASP